MNDAILIEFGGLDSQRGMTADELLPLAKALNGAATSFGAVNPEVYFVRAEAGSFKLWFRWAADEFRGSPIRTTGAAIAIFEFAKPMVGALVASGIATALPLSEHGASMIKEAMADAAAAMSGRVILSLDDLRGQLAQRDPVGPIMISFPDYPPLRFARQQEAEQDALYGTFRITAAAVSKSDMADGTTLFIYDASMRDDGRNVDFRPVKFVSAREFAVGEYTTTARLFLADQFMREYNRYGVFRTTNWDKEVVMTHDAAQALDAWLRVSNSRTTLER